MSALRSVTQDASFIYQDTAGEDSSVDSDSESDEDDEKAVTQPLNPGDNLDEITKVLQNDVRCLMDLELLIKAAVPDSKRLRSGKSVATETIPLDWAPHLVYSYRITQRFPKANTKLVTRLAELNLDRFLRTQAQRGANQHVFEDKPETEVEAVGADVLEVGTKFQDSALGTSLATPSSYAATEMSYKQDEGGRSVRIPPLPIGAKDGKEFECVACGKNLRIKSNSAWK